MTPILTPVKPEDAGSTAGPADAKHPTMKLYFAIQQVAGDAVDDLYQAIVAKHHLGFENPRQWADAMNAAIAIWNQRRPQDAAQIKAAYGV